MKYLENVSAAGQEYREGLQSGAIGCPMAKYAKPHVCDLGQQQEHFERTYQAIMDLHDGAGDTLILIPHEQPENYDEGKPIARSIWLALALTCRHFNQQALMAAGQQFGPKVASQFLRSSYAPSAYTSQQSEFTEAIAQQAEKIDTSNYLQGVGALEILCNRPQHDYLAFHSLFTFGTAPFYTPLIPGKRHPRHATSFAFVVNFTSDISGMVRSDPAGLQKVRDWMRESTGHMIYQQAIYPPRELEAPSPADLQRLRSLGVISPDA